MLRRDVGLKVSGLEIPENGFEGLEVRSTPAVDVGFLGEEIYEESSWIMESAPDPDVDLLLFWT